MGNCVRCGTPADLSIGGQPVCLERDGEMAQTEPNPPSKEEPLRLTKDAWKSRA
jgi:hypothetical protein